MPARAAVARAQDDALALEVAQRRDRQVAAREHPDRLVEQAAHRAQLGVFRMPTFLLLGGEASLQAADEVAFDERRRDPEVVVDQGAQRQATLQRPQGAAALLVLDAGGAPNLDLHAVLAQSLLGIAWRDRSTGSCRRR